MEGNSAAVECLILFYINMKHTLKTKQLVEMVFIDQMVKHCKESRFNYSDEEIKSTWKTIISKFTDLKARGMVEDKEKWKYFEILESCYEQSDFHNEVYPKFSEEMVWLLIECFLKRKALERTQKLSDILVDIHKEFVRCGYIYVSKQDIENVWKYLNLKYEKLKKDPETLKKIPHLQALKRFHEKEHIVNMIFTRELTEILIERFTEKKVTCIIHGYDSDQVLSEIHSEFIDLGFYFSKEDIKEKWRTLSNIYKFLVAKGKNESSWVYFNAMKNHFQNNFLFSQNENNKETNKSEGKSGCLRHGSKSVPAESIKKESLRSGLFVLLKKLKQGGKKRSIKKKSAKYRKKNKSKRKSKVGEGTNSNLQENEDSCLQTKDISTNKVQLNLSVDLNQERRNSTDLSPKSTVHIININQSDIDTKSGNLTINLPSITKKFSDNEFLPLKKRLRTDGENIDVHSDDLKEIKDGFRGFSPENLSETDKPLPKVNENKRLTEDEMSEIMERVNVEKSHENNNKLNCENMTLGLHNYHDPEEFNKYGNIHNNIGPQCLILPKREHPENVSMPNSSTPNITGQPPVLLLVIKVDGSNNPLKDNLSNEVNVKINETCLASKIDSKKGTDNPIPINSKSKTRIQGDGSELNEANARLEYSGITANLVKRVSSKSNGNNSDVSVAEIEPVSSYNVTLQNGCENVHNDENEFSGIDTVAENVTVYTSEDNQNVQTSAETGEIVFREPLPIIKKVDTTSAAIMENNSTLHGINPQISNEKVRLPVKGGGKLKEIFISPRELNKIAKLKPACFKSKNISTKSTDVTVSTNTLETNVSIKKTPQLKFLSQVITPANSTENNTFTIDSVTNQHVNDDSAMPSQSLKVGSKLEGINNYLQNRNGKNEEFENESVFSEAVGDDDVLKNNLLATVIDFQEQNIQEFIEIKNLIKQNNLLQRETNRLLRLMFEKQ